MAVGALRERETTGVSATGRRKGVLILCDTRAFGAVTCALLEPVVAEAEPIRAATYERAPNLLTPRTIKETALFIAELWRGYPTGWRAEGLAVAEQLTRLGANVLIVSPLSLGIDAAESYWDLASTDSLATRVNRLLRRPAARNQAAVLDQLSALEVTLSDYIAKPLGHVDG